MDDSFKKMSEDLNASYDKSFWQDAQANLENDALDEAFRNAAGETGTTAGIGLAAASLGDAFMDDAFQEAAEQVSATYTSAHWEALQAAMPDLQMDDAFNEASKEVKASYSPVYWGAANTALEKEGLHYEYNSAYWNEAKTLLDSADRKSFFTKWTGVAGILLLISMLGIYGGTIEDDTVSGQHMAIGLNELNENRLARLNQINGDENTANVQLTENQTNIADVIVEDNSTPNNGEQAMNLVAENNYDNQVSNNSENTAGMIQEDEVNETGDLLDPNNELDPANNSNEDYTQEEASPNAISPNPLVVDLNEGTEDGNAESDPINENYYNPLNNGMRNIGLNNLSQSPQPVQTESNDADLSFSTKLIDRMSIPSALIKLDGSQMPNRPLATVESTKLRNVHTYSILAGAGKGNGYGSESTIWTNRYYAGLAFNTYGFGKLRKFNFGFDVVLDRSEHEDLKQEKREQFFLENTTTETEYVKVGVSQLYNLNANLNASYEFIPKHKLRFGVGLSRVVSATSNVASNFRGKRETNEYVYLNNNFDINNGNNEIPDGLERIDLSLTLGYEFQLSNRFSLQIAGKYGLFDRTNDLNFQNNTLSSEFQSIFDNERSVTIGLKYNLFRVTK